MENTIRLARTSGKIDMKTNVSFAAYAATHVGKIRGVNEDSVLDLGEIGLWVVADGVGGADAGDYASQLIVQSLGRIAAPASAAAFIADVQRSLEGVNGRLREEAAVAERGRLIASTVVCLLFFGDWYCCVWAGDSRIYRLRGDRLELMTHDHSEVQSLVDYGLITAEEARRHPSANVITRAVGAEDVLRLDAVEGPIEAGDAFLLCSDGLTKVVDDWEIGTAVAHRLPRDAVQHLIQTTLDRGAPDNVSVAVVKTTGAYPDYDGGAATNDGNEGGSRL
jgi:serine/threonine-protein phosphatase Stp1